MSSYFPFKCIFLIPFINYQYFIICYNFIQDNNVREWHCNPGLDAEGLCG